VQANYGDGILTVLKAWQIKDVLYNEKNHNSKLERWKKLLRINFTNDEILQRIAEKVQRELRLRIEKRATRSIMTRNNACPNKLRFPCTCLQPGFPIDPKLVLRLI
jgi:tetrahydromethanopterin S-methyltransferase subunit G